MGDSNVFERLVADEMQRRAGPDPVVDDAAIFTAITATQSPKWRFQSMFSATKFLVAGAILALFGGFLLSGVLTQQPSDEPLPPAAVSASATAQAEPTDAATTEPESTSEVEADGTTTPPDLLPGVDLVTEEIGEAKRTAASLTQATAPPSTRATTPSPCAWTTSRAAARAENTTYQSSPHAQVPCAECHIGEGASFWVRSKIDGIRQVVKTVTNTYDRPIATPVESLRPAQETCEQCHWPNQFYGRKLITQHYYRSDEPNSPWTISLAVNVGGGEGTPDAGSDGIHFHMLVGKTIEYLAVDDNRQVIPWVRVTRDDGTVSVFSDPNISYPDPDDPDTELRTFDCVDCHNRPSHQFLPPAVAVNEAIALGSISRDLPFVRRNGLELLNAPYETAEQAEEAIRSALTAFYWETYPDRADEFSGEIERAANTLVDIYVHNFFPEMTTDYRAHLNNLSHFVNEGCFRCHGSDKVDESGNTITKDCTACHTIVAQGPSDSLSDLDQDLTGLEFVHPVDIGDTWQEINCTGCHTPEQGY